MRKKLAPGLLIFLRMPFLMFEKRIWKKNCARTFKVGKCAFFNI